MTPTQTEALSRISALILEAGLRKDDVLSLFPSASSSDAVGETSSSSSLLQRVMLYIGGIFVFSGVCIYAGIVWEDLNSLARVVITLGSGIVAFSLALFAGLSESKYQRAATPLFLAAGFLQPVGLFVFLHEYFPSSNDIAKAACLVFGVLTLQHLLVFSARARPVLLFLGLSFFYLFLFALMEKADVGAPHHAMIAGISGLVTAWGASRRGYAAISSLFFFFAGGFVLAAAFDYLEDTRFDVLLVAVSAGILGLSVAARSRALLVVGVLGLFVFLAYYTNEYFKDLVGWPIALIVMGFVMMGVSALAVRLGKKIRKAS